MVQKENWLKLRTGGNEISDSLNLADCALSHCRRIKIHFIKSMRRNLCGNYLSAGETKAELKSPLCPEFPPPFSFIVTIRAVCLRKRYRLAGEMNS